MLYRISVTERGLTGIANIFRSRLSRLDDLLGAGTVPLRQMSQSLLCICARMRLYVRECTRMRAHVYVHTYACTNVLILENTGFLSHITEFVSGHSFSISRYICACIRMYVY